VRVSDVETDALYDTSSIHLAQVFGQRTVQMIRDGRDPYEAARLAAGFAERYLAERPKVIGRITPEAPWGDATTCLVSDADYRKYWT
jgi:hypothetical protein